MKILNESSLSRIWSHNVDYKCAALSAFRKFEDCGRGIQYTHKDNQKRSKSLKTKLMVKDYGITVLSGMYPEGGKSVKETSFFVVNLNDDSDFFENIIKLGEKFDQDSVLIIPKGAIDNKAKAYLYGTNKCEDNDIGFHDKYTFEKGKLGKSSKIYTSFVNGRPFIFEYFERDVIKPGSGFGIWMMHLVAKMDWKNINV